MSVKSMDSSTACERSTVVIRPFLLPNSHPQSCCAPIAMAARTSGGVSGSKAKLDFGDDTEAELSSSTSSSSSSLQSDFTLTSSDTTASSSLSSLSTSFADRRARPLFDIDEEELSAPLLLPINLPDEELAHRTMRSSRTTRLEWLSVDSTAAHPLQLTRELPQTAHRITRPTLPKLSKQSPLTDAQRSLQSLLTTSYVKSREQVTGLTSPAPLCPRDLAHIPSSMDLQICFASASVMLQTLSLTPQVCFGEAAHEQPAEPSRGRRPRYGSRASRAAAVREDKRDCCDQDYLWDLPTRWVVNSDQYRQLACEQAMMQMGKISRPLKTRAVLNWTKRHPRLRKSHRSTLLRNVVTA